MLYSSARRSEHVPAIPFEVVSRDAPNVFLRRYLAEKGVGLQLDWGALGEIEFEPIFQAVEEAPQKVRTQCEAHFCEIDNMADGGRGEHATRRSPFPRS